MTILAGSKVFGADLFPSKRIFLSVADEGTSLSNKVSSLNFVGSGITCTVNGATVTCTVSGGGGGGGGSIGIFNGTSFVGSASSITFTGSGLSGIAFQNSMATVTILNTGDNLGTHVASTTLNMANNPIVSISSISVSSLTIVNASTTINGVAYLWPPTLTAGNCLQVSAAGVLSWATCGSGGGAGDNLGTGIATGPLNMAGFGILSSSGIAIGTPTSPNALLYITTGAEFGGSFILITTGPTPGGVNLFNFKMSSWSVQVQSITFSYGNSTSPFFMTIGSTWTNPYTLAVGDGRDLAQGSFLSASPSVSLYIHKIGRTLLSLRDESAPPLAAEVVLGPDSGGGTLGTRTNSPFSIYTNGTGRLTFNALGGLRMKTTDFIIAADGGGIALGTATPKAQIHIAMPNGVTSSYYLIMSTGSQKSYEFTPSSFTCNTTFFIGANPIFNTTSTAVNLSGYTIMVGTGSVLGAGTLTVSPIFPSGLVPTFISHPMITEFNNTGLTSNALEVGTWNPGSATFTVKNQDVTNARNFIYWVFGL